MRKVDLVKRYCCVLQILDSSIDIANEEQMVRRLNHSMLRDQGKALLTFALKNVFLMASWCYYNVTNGRYLEFYNDGRHIIIIYGSLLITYILLASLGLSYTDVWEGLKC